MQPQILQMLGQSQTTMPIQQIRQMIGTIRNMKNPQAMLEQMMQSNPQIQQAMNYINQNGGNAKDAFYALARQKGVDPESVLKMFR